MLRGCKFNLAKTKKKIEVWNTVRSFCPELFDNWDVDDEANSNLLDLGICISMPGYDKHGRKVMVYRPQLADPKKYSADDMGRIMDLATDLWTNLSEHQKEVFFPFKS